MAFDETELLQLLQNCQDMMEGKPAAAWEADPAIRQHIEKLLGAAKVFAEPDAAPASEKAVPSPESRSDQSAAAVATGPSGSPQKSGSSHSPLAPQDSSDRAAATAKPAAKVHQFSQCAVCGMEREGQFLRGYFKCHACVGHFAVRPPACRDAHAVPSVSWPAKFAAAPEAPNYIAEVRRLVAETSAGGSPFRPPVAKTDETGAGSPLQPPAASPEGSDAAPLTGWLGRGTRIPTMPLRRVKYMTSLLPYPEIWGADPAAPGSRTRRVPGFRAPIDLAPPPSANQPSAAGEAVAADPAVTPEAALRELRERVAALLHFHHPCFLFLFALAPDPRSGTVRVVSENAAPLLARGLAVGDGPNFELLRQVAAVGVHSLGFLFQRGLAHGQVRPHHFFVDVHRHVKLKLAPFPLLLSAVMSDTARLRPEPPFAPPECERDDGGEGGAYDWSSMANAQARDAFALGVSLSFFAFGVPRPPNDDELEQFGAAEAASIAEVIRGLTDPDPAKRLTPAAAAVHSSDTFLTVRLVNGAPVETAVCDIVPVERGACEAHPAFGREEVEEGGEDDDDDVDMGLSSPPVFDPKRVQFVVFNERKAHQHRPTPAVEPASPTFVAGSSILDSEFSASPEPVLPGKLSREQRKEGTVHSSSEPAEAEALTGGQVLAGFLRQQGPAIQVVRTPRFLTLYSVKNDPRRRRHQSRLAESTRSGRSGTFRRPSVAGSLGWGSSFHSAAGNSSDKSGAFGLSVKSTAPTSGCTGPVPSPRQRSTTFL